MRTVILALAALLLAQPLAAPAQPGDADARIRDAERRLEEAARELADLKLGAQDEQIRHVIRTMRRGGDRAMLGINIGSIRIAREGAKEALGERPEGVEILGVTPGGPADDAGLRAGDVIVALDGSRLAGQGRDPMRQLMQFMDEVEPGDTVTVSYLREGGEQTAAVLTRTFEVHGFGFGTGHGEDFEMFFGPGDWHGVLPHLPALTRHRAWRGLELVRIGPELGRYFDAQDGLLVVRAPTDEELPLQAGDVILSIGGAKTTTVPDAMRQLRFYRPGDELELEIMRDKRKRTVEIAVPGDSD